MCRGSCGPRMERSESPGSPGSDESRYRRIHCYTRGVQPHYVLAAHSLGGLNVRIFQSIYPSEIVGMVLVEASHPDRIVDFPTINALLANYQRRRSVEFLMTFCVSRQVEMGAE